MTPEFARFRQTFDAGVQQGLTAAAAIYAGAIREKLQRGYTTGDFVTGATAASVQMTPVEPDEDGALVRVGSNEMITLYWELGHINLFTRKYERVEHWRATLDEQGDAMAAAFGGTVRAVLDPGSFIGPTADPSYQRGAP